MHPMLNIAVRAGRKAGDIIVRHLDRVQGMELGIKGQNDFVTEVDRLAERLIIDTIRNAYPNHAILAEESGETRGNEFQWIIDPLDGTTNFLHGYPQFGVSIALKHRGRIEQAVVYDPLRQELYTATQGDGAFMNDRRIRVSRRPGLDGALLGTGFPIRRPDELDTYLTTFKALFKRTAGIRRAGAACLDLAHVASGRLDGFWESGLQAWDLAAGVLLIQEAGGLVGDLDGTDTYLESGNVLAGNPKVFDEMSQVIRDLLVPSLSQV